MTIKHPNACGNLLLISDIFYMRMRALGECGLNKLQQFAVLSYKPAEVKKNFGGYPQRVYPAYEQKFHSDPVVSFDNNKS